MNDKDIGNAVVSGLETLSDPTLKVPSSNVENLAIFKQLLRALIRGELVIADPTRIIPEGMELPELQEKGDKV